MPSIEDFTKPDGTVDWTGYEAAKVEAGEKCSQCGDFIIASIFGPKVSGPRRCYSCMKLAKGDQVEHDRQVRCPKCRHEFQATGETVPIANVWEDSATAYCPSCSADFQVGIRVTIHYTSPEVERGQKEDEEEPTEEGKCTIRRHSPDCTCGGKEDPEDPDDA